ncbi:MAG: hypothetical protein A2289_04090 [Deltaproteobacteria bacterium RIFOXYA12_FULL_58_15]|nr:MAG: hypothetical protein A2289_04090 [Deltaproteobacteria bacterium RIFOXYA12_FULL_58_15]OGR14594.1 MAG: hypothetical protein A2341_07500 [Deltaproteobacteria bacterium RIFOXYB12_FULL_58_9]
MARRAILNISFVSLFALASGCNGDDLECTLNSDEPLLSTNAWEGVLGFDLSVEGASHRIDVVFVNGGCSELKIDVDALRLQGEGAGVFHIGEVDPPSGKVAPRGDFIVPITFTSPGRGVYIAELVVESNAANLPVYTLELVGPGAGQRIPDEPDIEFFTSEVTLEDNPFVSVPAGIVRFYNLGGRTLTVDSFVLNDTTNFAFLGGSVDPGATCEYGAICGPGDGPGTGCCAGGLKCRCEEFNANGVDCEIPSCADVTVTTGLFHIRGVQFTAEAAAGSHSTTMDVYSNDPDTDPASVNLTGTK